MKKFFWISALFLLSAGIALLILARYAEHVAEPYILTFLEHNKPGHHKIEYGKIRLNLLNSTVNIRDVRVFPEPEYSGNENVWMVLNVGLIKLKRIDLWELFFHKNLYISDFIILRPETRLHLPDRITSQSVENVASEEDVQVKPQLLKSIALDKMIISGGTFRLYRNEDIIASSDNIGFLARNISLVKNTDDDPLGYSYGEVKFILTDLWFQFETGLYDMGLDKFTVVKKDSSVILEGFRMKPKYGREEFSKQLKSQDDRFNIDIGKIEVAGIGYRRFLEGNPLEITRIMIDGMTADIYRDKNVPFDLMNYPEYYNELFLKLSIPLQINAVEIDNSRLIYSELATGAAQAGEILFEDFKLVSYKLNNRPVNDSVEDFMQINVKAKIMGEGPLNADLVLPLEGNTRAIRCSGSVGAMKVVPLNGMLEPSINIKFNDGLLTRMTFAFEGDERLSSGWMEFLYKDLNVAILKKEPGKEWGLLSMLANTVTLSNNPHSGKDPKIVAIGYERDRNKGVINFIWKTIQSGMIRTIIPVNKYQINKKQKEVRVPEGKASKKKK